MSEEVVGISAIGGIFCAFVFTLASGLFGVTGAHLWYPAVFGFLVSVWLPPVLWAINKLDLGDLLERWWRYWE